LEFGLKDEGITLLIDAVAASLWEERFHLAISLLVIADVDCCPVVDNGGTPMLHHIIEETTYLF
jgi:hypothetical protein